MSSDLIGFGVFADVSQAEADLLSLGGSGAEAGATLEAGLAGASDSMKELGKRSSDASRGIQGFAAVVSLVDPRLGQVVRSVGTLARGLSVLRLGIGPAAVAVGALVGALALYQRQQEKNARLERLSNEARNAALSVDQRRVEALEDLEVALGNVTEKEQQILAIRRQAFVESQPDIQKLTSAIVAQRSEVEKLQGNYDSMLANGAAESFASITRDSLNEATASLRRLNADRNTLIEALREEVQTRIQIVEIEDEIEAGEKRATELAGLRAEVAKTERDARMSVLNEEAQIEAVYREQIARLDEIADKSRGRVDTVSARLALTAEKEAELDELRREREEALHQERIARQEQLALARQDAHDREMIRLEEERARREQNQADALTFLGDLTTAAILSAEKRAAGDEAAAERVAGISRGLARTEIVLAGAVGVRNAVARTAGRPGAALFAVGQQLASTAAQLAAIQKAHQGDNIAPDERIHRGRRVLTDEVDDNGRIMSPEASRRLERGEHAAVQVVPVPVYQHLGAWFADAVQGGTTPLTDAINAGRDIGRRSSY